MNSKSPHQLLKQLGISEQSWSAAMQSAERIEKLDTPKGCFWLKKAAPARGVFRYHALNLFSWLLRLPLLKAVPQPGGAQAVATEVNRLEQLTSAGITVPSVVAKSTDWLLINDVGVSIIKIMKQPSTTQSTQQQLFQMCLDAIKLLHQQGQYLSQGFIRNMLWVKAEDKVAFIDFEDDPLEVMTLAEAQARDLLLLVNSTARFFVNDPTFFQHSIQRFIADHDNAMVQSLRITTQRMQWVTRIPFQKLLGHDYQKLKVGIAALKDI